MRRGWWRARREVPVWTWGDVRVCELFSFGRALTVSWGKSLKKTRLREPGRLSSKESLNILDNRKLLSDSLFCH